jgi:hypothetical protein
VGHLGLSQALTYPFLHGFQVLVTDRFGIDERGHAQVMVEHIGDQFTLPFIGEELITLQIYP